MIALVRGRLAGLDDDHAVVDAGGVGYQVYCHLRTLALLAQAGDDEVVLQVHTGVTADAIRLYGFTTVEELRLFRLLIGVERIGPKAALGLLGRAELPVMVRAIREGDVALVATVPGIGRKTAERVVLELRDKVGDHALPGDRSSPADVAGRQLVTAAVEGLAGLGFREADARVAVVAALADLGGEPKVAALVGAALRRLDAVGTAR